MRVATLRGGRQRGKVRYLIRSRINVSIRSLDGPTGARPERQYGVASAMAWFGELPDLPGSRTEDDIPPDMLSRLVSRQHPDHD